jgi:hypothetical protein
VPRFFFDLIEDGIPRPDHIGSDLPDEDAARRYAFTMMTDFAREKAHQPGQVTVEVRAAGEDVPVLVLNLDADEM